MIPVHPMDPIRFPVPLRRLFTLMLLALLVLAPACEEEDDDVADDDAADDDVGDDDSGDDDTAGDDDSGDDDTSVDPNEVVIGPPAGVTDVDTTTTTEFESATEFLYTGVDPPQVDVDLQAMESHRLAVIRGRVLDRDGAPLPDVECSVLGRPEFGRTWTRADGGFDLAVNGGGQLTVRFRDDLYIPAQRQVVVPWHDYVWLPDVRLVPYNGDVASIDLTPGAPLQVARGSEVSDADGTRQATLLFSADTTAEMILANGSTVALTTASVRATEFTVGDAGPDCMPAALPPTSAYTYAVELSIDEAIDEGATEVVFDRPVAFYLEDFLGFPVGLTVPAGFLDRERGVWVAGDSGRVVEVLDTTGGQATLDVDGSGLPADQVQLDDLGINADELVELANLYSAGQRLWRVPISHFSPWDMNWGWGPPDNGVAPGGEGGGGIGGNPEDDDTCITRGSIIECHNQILGKSLPLVGSDLGIHYRSNRVPGWVAGRRLRIQLSGPDIPTELEAIEVSIRVAGRLFEYTFPGLPDQAMEFIWDGMDAYGRLLQGEQPVTVHIGYEYEGVYEAVERFGYNGNGMVITGDPTRQRVTLWGTWFTTIGVFDVSQLKLGGWTLGAHHAYDPVGKTVYYGDGTRWSSAGAPPLVIHTDAGGGAEVPMDGMLATDVEIQPNGQIVVGPDGSLFFSGYPTCYGGPDDRQLYQVDAAGLIWVMDDTFLGGVETVGDDGSIYYVYQNVWKRDPEGNEELVMADNELVHDEFGNQLFMVGGMSSVALGPDGALYGTGYNQVFRKGTDGTITLFAGTGDNGYSGDGGLAIDATFQNLVDLDVGPDGRVYLADRDNNVIRMIDLEGFITTIAGNGVPGYSGDGGYADEAESGRPDSVAVGKDGSVYFTDVSNSVVRRVDPQGIITTVAGGADLGWSFHTPDGTPAPVAELYSPSCAELDPLGNLYLIDTIWGNWCEDWEYRIRSLHSPIPAQSADRYVVPSEDGAKLYLFDLTGRHLQTLNAFTGATLLDFQYDQDGLLVAIEDAYGNVTDIARDGSGDAVAVVAPGGQETTLSMDVYGYLELVENPAQEQFELEHSASGRLLGVTNPRGFESLYAYDTNGRLSDAWDAAGGWKHMTRNEPILEGYDVTVETALGRSRAYTSEPAVDGDRVLTFTSSSGATNALTRSSDGTRTTELADGTIMVLQEGPDPRWGMVAPVAKWGSYQTPGGLSATFEGSREASLSDPYDLMSLEMITDTLTVNGRQSTWVFDAASQSINHTTPEGRQSNVYLDQFGRIVEVELDPVLEPFLVEYDAYGRLSLVTRGELQRSFTYDNQHRLVASEDAMGHETAWDHDAADRVVRKYLPGGAEIGFDQDPSGNLTLLTMPSGADYQLGYASRDFLESYTPPGNADYEWGYDLDSDLEIHTLPGGRELTVIREPQGGRLLGLDYDEAEVSMSYADVTARWSDITRTPTSGGDSQTIGLLWDGPLVTEIGYSGPAEGTFEYTYDDNFELTQIDLTSGVDSVTIPVQHDDDGLATQVGPFTFSRSGPAGLVDGIDNGVLDVDIEYDTLGRDVARTHLVAGLEVYRIELEYGASGSISRKTETVEGTERARDYTYDDDGRLLEVILDGVLDEAYTYDDNGNRTSTLTGTASYDAQDRLIDFMGISYQFDADGFLVQRGLDTFLYSLRGELLEATIGGETVIYTYDGLARRVSRTDSSGTTQYLYSGMPQRAPQGNARITASRGPDGLLSYFHYDLQGALIALDRSGEWFYVASDQAGTPVVVADSLGSVVEVLEYDSFGLLLSDSSPGFQIPIGFAGGICDEVTGLVRFGFRDYSPVQGRWLARDPILYASGQLNLYSYVWNDPVNNIDPLGLAAACTYTQSNGHLVCWDDSTFETIVDEWGYSGSGTGDIFDGYNDPTQQCVRNEGPLPRGEYDIGVLDYSENTGWYLPLDPVPENSMCSEEIDPPRSDMQMHGGDAEGGSSDGCIIMPYNVRRAISDAGGGSLLVF